MTETERLLRRQAEWQRARADLSWPDKIRQAERVRASVETLRGQRRRPSPASQVSGESAAPEVPRDRGPET
jgi:hypothetical protein